MINDDFQQRMAAFQAAIRQPKPEVHPDPEPSTDLVGPVHTGTPIPTLRCMRCGMERRLDQPGRSMRLCPECYSRQNGGVRHIDEDSPGYRLAACVTDMRIAIEIATTALRLGKHRDALLALERVRAPGRGGSRLTPSQTKELP